MSKKIKHAESYRAYYWPDDKRRGVDYVLSKRTPSNMKAGDCWCHVHCFKEMTGRRVFPRDYETSGKTNRKNHFWVGPGGAHSKRARTHPHRPSRLLPPDGCVVSNRVKDLGEDSGNNNNYDQFYSDLKSELTGSSQMWDNIDYYNIKKVEFPKKRQLNASDLIIHHQSGRDCTHVIIVNSSRHRLAPHKLFSDGRNEFNTVVLHIYQWTDEDVSNFAERGKILFKQQWDNLNSIIKQHNAEIKRRDDEIRYQITTCSSVSS